MIYLNLFSFVGNFNFNSTFHSLRTINAAFVVMGIHALKYLQSTQTNLHYWYLRSRIASSNLKKLVRFFFALLGSILKGPNSNVHKFLKYHSISLLPFLYPTMGYCLSDVPQII